MTSNQASGPPLAAAAARFRDDAAEAELVIVGIFCAIMDI
jgi:hypothetical protein